MLSKRRTKEVSDNAGGFREKLDLIPHDRLIVQDVF
jgi:hypothetical protein